MTINNRVLAGLLFPSLFAPTEWKGSFLCTGFPIITETRASSAISLAWNAPLTATLAAAAAAIAIEKVAAAPTAAEVTLSSTSEANLDFFWLAKRFHMP